MQWNRILHWFIFLFFVFISYGAVHNPFSENYIERLKEETLPATQIKNDELYNKIVVEAKKYERPAQDAIVHKVWKAIPGYNGLVVDVEASYKKMIKNGGKFSPDKLIFKETRPKVHLDDLPPNPIYKGNPEKPMVTFLVNVAWGNEHLPQMLKTMKKYDVKSTFFLDGSWVKKNPQLAKMIVEEGHEIGNHAYSHPDMRKLSKERIREELEKTNEVIYATLAVVPKYFAPPSGSFRQDVVEIAHELNMKTIMWSVDTVDWKSPPPEEMVQNVLQKVHPGAMILMHPTASTAEALEQLILGIRGKGLQIGTVTQLFDEARIYQHVK